MKSKLFNSFFSVHSQNVDNAEKQGFWKLTDKILETYLLENMSQRTEVRIADFGGGTGRWLLKMDQYFNNSEFFLVDLSDDMLVEAKKKKDGGLFKNE